MLKTVLNQTQVKLELTSALQQKTYLETLQRRINGDIVKAVESVFRITNTEGKLIDYKVAKPFEILLKTGLLGDRSALSRIIDKGRQGGFSVFQAMESSTIACMLPRTRQYYVATKEDQARSWLKKVEDMGKYSRTGFDGSRIIDIDTTGSSQLEKVFKNKINKTLNESYICGLSASPGGIRGESAIKVILDEYAQMVQRENQQKDVYTAIGYFIAGGGACDIQSTPLIKSDLFWQFYSNATQYGMSPFYFPIIENWKKLDLYKPLMINLNLLPADEVSKILKMGIYKVFNNVLINKKRVDNVAMQNMDIPYFWYDIGFLEKKRREDLSLFKQEVLGIPEDVVYRFIPPELWFPCVTLMENLIPNKLFTYKMAIDVAQKRDVTAITVGHKEDGVVKEDYVYETQSTYPQQKREIKEIYSYFKPYMDEIIIDNTGPGIGLADMIEEDIDFPSLRRVEFGSVVDIGEKKMRIPELMSLEFKKALNVKQYLAISHSVATAHILRIERIISPSGGSARYSGKRSGGRDDHFMSKIMLNLGFHDKYSNFLSSSNYAKMIGVMPDNIDKEVAQVFNGNSNSDEMLMW